jgi:hypothetical protein
MLAIHAQNIESPSKNINLSFKVSANGTPSYSVKYKNKSIVNESTLGIVLKEMPALESNFRIDSIGQKQVNETWQPVLGEQSNIKNNYNEMTVALSQPSTNRKINIIFRVFDEGVAFRYDFPKQDKLNYFIISDEKSQFNLTGDHKTFWLPGDFDSQEYPYTETKLSAVNTDNIDKNNGIGLKSIAGKYVIQSPLMMKSADGIYINIFEAYGIQTFFSISS